MKKTSPYLIHQLTLSALLIAMGLLLPQIFHLIGGSSTGSLFLPMHIPVLISGLLLGSVYGGAAGLITPLLSFMITGMPPVGKLPFMLIELCGYGIFTGFFAKRIKNLHFTVLLSQIGGRLFYALSLIAGNLLFQLNIPPLLTVAATITTGLPGIVIQLLFIPPIITLLQKELHFDRFTEKN